MAFNLTSSNEDDMEMRGRELVQHLFRYLENSNTKALEYFVRADTGPRPIMCWTRRTHQACRPPA